MQGLLRLPTLGAGSRLLEALIVECCRKFGLIMNFGLVPLYVLALCHRNGEAWSKGNESVLNLYTHSYVNVGGRYV